MAKAKRFSLVVFHRTEGYQATDKTADTPQALKPAGRDFIPDPDIEAYLVIDSSGEMAPRRYNIGPHRKKFAKAAVQQAVALDAPV